MTPAINASAILEQITALGIRMDKGTDELKILLSTFDGRLRAVEMDSSASKPVNALLMQEYSEKLKKHGDDIEALYTVTRVQGDSLDKVTGILRWLLYILTAIIIAVAIALLTGKATIVFAP